MRSFIFLLLGAGFTFLLLGQNVEAHDSEKHTAFERIKQTRTVRCGYIVWPPYVMKDPNTGDLSGINVDQMNAIAETLNLELDWTLEVGLDQIATTLQTGKADMMCSTLWASSNRSWELDFSNPTNYTPLYAMVRSDDTRFDNNAAAINNPETRIVFIEGDSPQAVANAKFPNAAQLALPNTSDGTHNLLNLITNKADVTFVDKYILNEFDKAHPEQIRAVEGIGPVQVFGETFAVKKGETKLRDMINVVLFELQNNGKMNAILDRYDTGEEAFLRVLSAYN